MKYNFVVLSISAAAVANCEATNRLLRVGKSSLVTVTKGTERKMESSGFFEEKKHEKKLGPLEYEHYYSYSYSDMSMSLSMSMSMSFSMSMSMSMDYSLSPTGTTCTTTSATEIPSTSPTVTWDLNQPTSSNDAASRSPSNSVELIISRTDSPTGVELDYNRGGRNDSKDAVTETAAIAAIVLGALAFFIIIGLILGRNICARRKMTSSNKSLSDVSLDSPPSTTTKSEHTSGERTASV